MGPTNASFYFSQTFADMNNDQVPDAIVTIGSYGVDSGKLLVYPGIDTNGVLSLDSGVMVYDQVPLLEVQGKLFHFTMELVTKQTEFYQVFWFLVTMMVLCTCLTQPVTPIQMDPISTGFTMKQLS